ncbi:hypothetical protein [Amorphus coralli]|uniref:hypothetical protein n=1 Tax=Amorphus coralli TaxID=340680 RepID=UPI000367590F|nr:hypothetical protein [Amorphus coralli]
MKIAVGLIGIFLSLLILLQSCAISAGSSLIDDQTTFEAGVVGVMVGFLFFFGGAFAFGLPIVSVVLFALGGLFGLAAAKDFPDLQIWGFVSLGLAVLALIVWRQSRRHRQKATE